MAIIEILIDGKRRSLTYVYMELVHLIRERKEVLDKGGSNQKYAFESRRKYMLTCLEGMKLYPDHFPDWTRNTSITDYLTSDDPDLFRIGYTLLSKEENL